MFIPSSSRIRTRACAFSLSTFCGLGYDIFAPACQSLYGFCTEQCVTIIESEVPRLTLLDYGICLFGAVGILLFLGVFGNLPPLILFFWGLFAIGICLLSVVLVIQSSFVRFSRIAESRTYVLYFGFNIIPAISFLVWQAGKFQVLSLPGCC